MVGKSRARIMLVQSLIVIAIVLVVNVIAQRLYTFVDLTEDKRYTLTGSTSDLLEEIDEPIFIDVLLAGDLPSGYKRLLSRTEEVINQMRNVNSQIEFNFRNPGDGTAKEVNTMRQNLATDGILPVNLIVMEDDQKVEKLIYPFAIIKYGSRRLFINLLDVQQKGESPEVLLNRSANSLEFKLISSIRKLYKKETPKVLFTTDNGELLESQTATLETGLSSTTEFGRINLDSTYQIQSDVDVLIVAGPRSTVSVRNKFIIDQYLMNGGKVIWLVETLEVNLDSINVNTVYIPKPIEHGLDDMFFKYGVKIKNDLVLDLQNSKIPQVIGRIGNKSQQELFPWVYYPLLMSSNVHPIVNNIDRTFSNFPSSIELLDNKMGLEQTVLLTTSQYSRFQIYPMRLSFEIVKLEQKPEAYNKPYQPVAVIVEGEFESFFKNRVSDEMAKGLQEIGAVFKEKSEPTTQIFISDVDIIKNLYDPGSNRISPLGYNRWEDMVYGGNSEFITNAIDYMTDEYGLMESRSKNLQLRMLDQVELKNNRLKWQILNLAGPIFLILIFGFVLSYFRKRKYS